jgi:hypothetical protein
MHDGWINSPPNTGGPPSGAAGGKLTGFYPNPGVVQATESATGIAEIATQAEVDAGLDDERFITPLKLANYPFPGGIAGINLENRGVTVPGAPHDTLNFDGCEVDVTDDGSGDATILIKISRSAIYAGYV